MFKTNKLTVILRAVIVESFLKIEIKSNTKKAASAFGLTATYINSYCAHLIQLFLSSRLFSPRRRVHRVHNTSAVKKNATTGSANLQKGSIQ